MKALQSRSNRIDMLRENIERTEQEIEHKLREIEDRLSFESLLPVVAARGKEVLTEKVKPLMNELGDTMKETLDRVFDSVNRDPLPVFLIGIGAGMVLLSLYSIRKNGPDGDRLAFADPATRLREETKVSGEGKAGPRSFASIKLGLSALALGAAMSGFVPGVDAEKVEGWKADLLAKAGEAGEEIIKGTEKMLRKKLNAEAM